MKTIIDYLKTNEHFDGYIGQHEITLTYNGIDVMMWCDGDRWSFNADAEARIQDTLYELDSTEIRFCEECGKPMDKGFMAGDGDWYCCEDCFEGAMNETYGKGEWRATENEGAFGGYYEYLDVNTWEDTGIFWTAWNE